MTSSGAGQTYAINGANPYSGRAPSAATPRSYQLRVGGGVTGGGQIASGPLGTGPVNIQFTTASVRVSASNGPQTVANPMTITTGLIPVGTK